MRLKKTRLESDIESAGHDYAKLRGWFTCKIESSTFNGMPDRLYIRRGVHRFAEWKKPDDNGDGGELSAQQVKRIREMQEHGADVRVIDNLEEFKAWMK
jgi:hypothetical protein